MIEGIPDGWELVKIGSPKIGDWFVNGKGDPKQAEVNYDTIWPIIRKIDKPKRFRPFANAAEAEPFWDKKLRIKESARAKEPRNGKFRIVAMLNEDVLIASQVYTYQGAFEIYECIDGTPFGIEVTE